jgi:hypothetical protein
MSQITVPITFLFSASSSAPIVQLQGDTIIATNIERTFSYTAPPDLKRALNYSILQTLSDLSSNPYSLPSLSSFSNYTLLDSNNSLLPVIFNSNSEILASSQVSLPLNLQNAISMATSDSNYTLYYLNQSIKSQLQTVFSSNMMNKIQYNTSINTIGTSIYNQLVSVDSVIKQAFAYQIITQNLGDSNHSPFLKSGDHVTFVVKYLFTPATVKSANYTMSTWSTIQENGVDFQLNPVSLGSNATFNFTQSPIFAYDIRLTSDTNDFNSDVQNFFVFL